MRVVEVWRYPVKSFRGERLEQVELDARGVAGDRGYAVRDRRGKLGSGKTTRRFRLLRGLFDYAAATVAGETVVHVPGGDIFAVDDPALDAHLSARYGEPLEVAAEREVPHFDAGAVHLLTTSSLRWVAERLGPAAADVRRYRPNVLLETGGAGLVEDAWVGETIELGTAVLRVVAPVQRCAMPNFAQSELAYDARVLRLLVRESAMQLGVYAEVVRPGTIAAG